MEIDIKNTQNNPEEETKFRGLMPWAEESVNPVFFRWWTGRCCSTGGGRDRLHQRDRLHHFRLALNEGRKHWRGSCQQACCGGYIYKQERRVVQRTKDLRLDHCHGHCQTLRPWSIWRKTENLCFGVRQRSLRLNTQRVAHQGKYC